MLHPTKISFKQKEKLRKLYYDELARRCREAMFQKVRSGEFPGCPPVGYRNGASWKGEPAIVVDEKLAPLVKEAFQMAQSNQYSLRAILKELTPKGLVSRNGKSLGPSALWSMLRNPFYTGRIRYCGELVPGKHKALVDDELFMEAVESLQSQKRH